MDFVHFQRAFRPAVDEAWHAYCRQTHSPDTKREKDRWYRHELEIGSAAHIHSTVEIRDDEHAQIDLIHHFQHIANDLSIPDVRGFSASQNSHFKDVVAKAWHRARCDQEVGSGDFSEWFCEQFKAAGGSFFQITGEPAADKRTGFDAIMGAFAILALDDYWASRTAAAVETRLRHVLGLFLDDLSYLENKPCDWAYAKAIYRQSGALPEAIGDATAQSLWAVLQMLDTHIRRLCKRAGIRPKDLPSR